MKIIEAAKQSHKFSLLIDIRNIRFYLMKYVHSLKYDYPSDPHGHMIAPKQVRKDNLNKDYPYYRNDFWYNFGRIFIEFVLIIVGVPYFFLRYGLKVNGKENRKLLKKTMKKTGVITICNHIFDEDYPAIRVALAPKMGYISMWKNNHLRRLGYIIRFSGSIPVPTNDASATISMMRAVDKCLQDGKWLHIYPEASMFYFYQDIRPFVDGTFLFAARNKKPIFPMAYSYRPVKGLYKLWKKKGAPLINLNFGEPIYPNPNLSIKDSIKDLSDRCHSAMKKLMEDNTPEVKDK